MVGRDPFCRELPLVKRQSVVFHTTALAVDQAAKSSALTQTFARSCARVRAVSTLISIAAAGLSPARKITRTSSLPP
jgi:hypothetical protein